MNGQKWSKRRAWLLLLPIVAAAPLWALGGRSASSSSPPQALLGKWRGEGKIIVSWCKQKQIAVELEIRPDRTVRGRIGDAELENAVIAPNSWLLVWLGNPEYAVEARLNGPLVKAEDIRRNSLVILLDVKDDHLQGDLHTHDSKFGDRDTMMFSVSYIELQRLPPSEPSTEAGRT
ncbi:MAG: hypothetical protein JXO51_00445 [Candidatus Aminicenantes bacterium]|nr:hypothetical protein [Candidatus Aminicenantes bacterium]